jgi:hypothetical protein
MSKAAPTKGTQILIETAPSTFTQIKEVYNLGGPSVKVDQIETTSFDSVAKEYADALQDSGEVTFDVRDIPEDPGQVALRAAVGAGVKNFKITRADATATLTVPTTITFAAIVTALNDTGATNDVFNASCTLKISGAVTRTARHAGP